MKANEIIFEMFRQSPLQKEWKPKGADAFIYKDVPSMGICHIVSDVKKPENLIWLPSQEDLQKKYWDNVGGPAEMCEPSIKEVDRLIEKIEDTFSDLSTWESSNDIVTRQPIVKGLNSLSYPDMFLLLWCLLVHQEVYVLVWDWEGKKWKTK